MFTLGSRVNVISDRPHAGLPCRTGGEVWYSRDEPEGMSTIRLTEAGFVGERLPPGRYYCVRWSGSQWDWFAETELQDATEGSKFG